MPRRSDRGADAPKTVDDLVRVSGLGKDAVRAAIRSGELPGVVVGSRYVIPNEAFQRFCRGEWQPMPRPVLSQPPTVIPDMIRTRKAS